MEYYLGIPVKHGLFCSPLRKDNTPTCSFYRNGNGDLIFKDFNGSFSGNFISVVMYKYSCTYHNALRIIASDFGLINTTVSKPVAIPKNVQTFKDEGPTKIQITDKEFTEKELNWWQQYGITLEVLKKFQVHSCKAVFLNDNLLTVVSDDILCFGYFGGWKEDLELWRIYYPLRKNYRFLSNWSASKIQGWEQLPSKGNLLVVTKSMKDCMTLYTFGIPAIAPNSETLFLSKEVLDELKQRFKHIIVLYDNDLPGIANMNKIKKQYPELLYMWIPRRLNAKDISDFRKLYGPDKTKELIKRVLKWLSRRISLQK